MSGKLPLFSRPLPWTDKTWDELQNFANKFNPFEIIWWWKPFHETGFAALQYAAEHFADQTIFRDWTANLSVPGGHENLDPEKQILVTWAAAENNITEFGAPNARLFSIQDLLSKKQFRVDFSSEEAQLSKFLTRDPQLLKRFHEADSKTRAKIVELFSGHTKSFSKLRVEVL